MAHTPGLPVLKAFLNVPTADTRDDVPLQQAFDAAEAYVRARCSGSRGDWALWPADMRQALLLMASRLHARRNSPDGLAVGMDGLDAMRVSGRDPDVSAMLAPYMDWAVG